MSSFGRKLRACRHQTRDPQNKYKSLTLKRFAEELYQVSGERFLYTGATISNWETGNSKSLADDRDLLLAVVKTLHDFGGIANEKEANQLLRAGFHETLRPEECAVITPNLLEDIQDQTARPQQIAPGDPWLFFYAVVRQQFAEARSQLRPSPEVGKPSPSSTIFTGLLGRLTPRKILFTALWLVIVWLVWLFCLPLLYWPPEDILRRSVLFTAGAILLPGLAALLVWAGQRGSWPEKLQSSSARYGFSYIGALTGFFAVYLFTFAAMLIIFDFGGPSLGGLGTVAQLLTAGLIVYASFIGAEQLPYSVWIGFEHFAFGGRDFLILITLWLLGILVAGFFYCAHPLLLGDQHISTILVFALVVIMASFSVIQQRRGKTSVIPTYGWALVFGILWIVCAAAVLDTIQVGVVIGSVTVVAIGLFAWERIHG